jgi:hypothetical protein
VAGHAWIFCGGDLGVGGVLRFAPSGVEVGLAAWFGRLEHASGVVRGKGCRQETSRLTLRVVSSGDSVFRQGLFTWLKTHSA